LSEWTLGLMKTTSGQLTIKDTRKLSDEEVSMFKSSQKEMQRFAIDERMMLMILQNFQDFHTLIELISERWGQEARMNPLILENIYMEINRLMINTLATFSSYLNLTERKLKELDNGLARFDRFKEACSTAYDNNFSYRFLYHLRNFSQHYELPIGQIRPSARLNDLGEKEHSLAVMFHRDSLLKTKYKWKPEIRSEIENLDEELDVSPLLEDLVNCIWDIDNVASEDRITSVNNSSIFLESLMEETATEEGTPCIYRLAQADTRADMEIMHFPLHVIEVIRLLREQRPDE